LRVGWLPQAGGNRCLDGLFRIMIAVTAYRQMCQVKGPQVAVENLRPQRDESVKYLVQVPQLVEIIRFIRWFDDQRARRSFLVFQESKRLVVEIRLGCAEIGKAAG
jgi:hypothetical protein